MKEVYQKWKDMPNDTWYKIEKIDVFSSTDKYAFLLELISSNNKDRLYVVTLSKRIKDKILELNVNPREDDVFIYKAENKISQYWIF